MKNKYTLNHLLLILILVMLMMTGSTQAQEIRWQRQAAPELDLTLFHSTQVMHLPTAETLQKGDFQFEILHRFNTPVSSGVGQVWGLDGTVTMRIGLGYAPADRMLLTLARSNREGNIDLQAKYKAFQIRDKTVPTLISLQAGAAYNGKPVQDVASPAGKFQYFGQIIANTLIGKTFGIGIVPGYVYNSNIYDETARSTFTLGSYLQHYMSEKWSLIIEYNAKLSGWQRGYDALALGIEIETGGHFFKMSAGNSIALNLPQFMAGAPDPISSKDWHLGFNITRLF